MKKQKLSAKSAVHKHEKAMHPGKTPTPLKHGGAAKGYSSGGRISPLADTASKNPLAYGAK